jgi:hypothetical protein
MLCRVIHGVSGATGSLPARECARADKPPGARTRPRRTDYEAPGDALEWTLTRAMLLVCTDGADLQRRYGMRPPRRRRYRTTIP